MILGEGSRLKLSWECWCLNAKAVRLGALWHCLVFKLCSNHFKSISYHISIRYIMYISKTNKHIGVSLSHFSWIFFLKLPRCQFSMGSSLIPRNKVGWTYQLHCFGLGFCKQNMDHEYRYTTIIRHILHLHGSKKSHRP